MLSGRSVVEFHKLFEYTMKSKHENSIRKIRISIIHVHVYNIIFNNKYSHVNCITAIF